MNLLHRHQCLRHISSSCNTRQTRSVHTTVALPPQNAATATSRSGTTSQKDHQQQQQHHSQYQRQQQQQQDALLASNKRSLLLGLAGCVAASWLAVAAPTPALAAAEATSSSDLVPANPQLDKRPDQSQYNPAVRRRHSLSPVLPTPHGHSHPAKAPAGFLTWWRCHHCCCCHHTPYRTRTCVMQRACCSRH